METINRMGQETIGELVTKDLRRARVMRKYKIDFCCGGKKTLEQVCNEKKIDSDTIERELVSVTTDPRTTEGNADQWEADFLADYIVNVHHTYVKQAMPVLLEWANKVALKHGERCPEVIEVNRLFNEAAAELSLHMMKEENILFPYVKQLCASKRAASTGNQSPFGGVINPINVMEKKHELVGEIFMKLEKLTNNFNPPMDACNTHRALYANLLDFENDLFLHIHLENNILFPKAVELERELSTR